MRISNPPAGFTALASQIRWTPSDLLGPCYAFWSDSSSASPDGYSRFAAAGLALGSDSSFYYSLHPPAGGGDDLQGRRLRSLERSGAAGGAGRIRVDLTDGPERVEPGLYFLRASSRGQHLVKRVVVLR